MMGLEYWPMLGAWDQWGLFVMPHLLWRGDTVFEGLPTTHNIHFNYRELGKGSVNDLDEVLTT